MLYAIVCVASIIIRQFYLPNPFECFGEIATFINVVAEPIIHTIAFAIVGWMGYKRGSIPALGSFLYLIAYSAIVGLLKLFSIHSFAWWWILTVVLIPVGLIVGVKLIVKRVFPRQEF